MEGGVNIGGVSSLHRDTIVPRIQDTPVHAGYWISTIIASLAEDRRTSPQVLASSKLPSCFGGLGFRVVLCSSFRVSYGLLC